jgi:hypothetical protein
MIAYIQYAINPPSKINFLICNKVPLQVLNVTIISDLTIFLSLKISKFDHNNYSFEVLVQANHVVLYIKKPLRCGGRGKARYSTGREDNIYYSFYCFNWDY